MTVSGPSGSQPPGNTGNFSVDRQRDITGKPAKGTSPAGGVQWAFDPSSRPGWTGTPSGSPTATDKPKGPGYAPREAPRNTERLRPWDFFALGRYLLWVGLGAEAAEVLGNIPLPLKSIAIENFSPDLLLRVYPAGMTGRDGTAPPRSSSGSPMAKKRCCRFRSRAWRQV
jgi:hypothetical protein